MRRAHAGRSALAACIAAVAVALGGCRQSITVLGPAARDPSAPSSVAGTAAPTPQADGGPVRDPDAEGAGDAAVAPPPAACDACGTAQLCAIDRCVDAAAVRSLAMSHAHACDVVEGRLFCWGGGEHGQLGNGDARGRDTPTRVGSFNDWLQVAAGEASTCAVRAPGVVYCWGDNSSAQLGLGDTEPRREPAALPLPALVREVACGGESCCAIDRDAQLWCWGDNLEGKPGLGDRYGAQDVTTPARARVSEGAGFRALAVGQGHVCAIAEDGGLWCWGRNTNAQLGIGLEPGQTRAPGRVGDADDWDAIAVSQHHSCGVREDGTLWCWGENAFFEVGAPDPALVVAEPRQVGSDRDWAAAALGWFHTCALKRDGRLFCWGRAIEGQLGREMPIAGQRSDLEGNPVPEPGAIAAPAAWLRVVAGNFQSCGLDSGGRTLCWGDNSSGQLGVGDEQRRALPEPVR
jgi:alpha-tubulin suppressor-like RCC1 family protein